MLTPSEADVLKTALTGLCGLLGAVVTAWAGITMARLKVRADAAEVDVKRQPCPSASEIAEHTLASVFHRTGEVDADFWPAVRMWPRVQQALLGRHDQLGSDTSALVHLVPQIAAHVKTIHDHIAEEKREREIEKAAKALAQQAERKDKER